MNILIAVFIIVDIFIFIKFGKKIIKDLKTDYYRKGYEQGCWDSAIYANGHFGERGLLSYAFRRYLCEKKASPQTTEGIWELEDDFNKGILR